MGFMYIFSLVSHTNIKMFKRRLRNLANIRLSIWLAVLLVMITACGADSEADIVEDVEAQQSDTSTGMKILTNDTDQNKRRVQKSEHLENYADEAGYYLNQSATLLTQLSPYFDRAELSTSDLNDVLSILTKIRDERDAFINLERPRAFEGFHNVHLSTLMEIDALERIFRDMRSPTHPLQIDNARVHYENAIMSHKLMEREYLTLMEEYGLY